MLVLLYSGLNHTVNIPCRFRSGIGVQIPVAGQDETAYRGCCLSQWRVKLVCFSSLWYDCVGAILRCERGRLARGWYMFWALLAWFYSVRKCANSEIISVEWIAVCEGFLLFVTCKWYSHVGHIILILVSCSSRCGICVWWRHLCLLWVLLYSCLFLFSNLMHNLFIL
jgi:hypothetical protein